MTEPRWQTARLDEIQQPDTSWAPIRRHFDIRAFGVNAWVARADGDDVIAEHTESAGHQELYFVTGGRATFTVDGEELDAPAGTLVFVRDPETTRKAVAVDAGTTILAIGAKAGEAFQVLDWEAFADFWPLYRAGDYEAALQFLEEVRAAKPETAVLLYNIACVEALLGRTDDALEHLRQAAEREERFREAAKTDSDLDSIRDDPRFTSLLETS